MTLARGRILRGEDAAKAKVLLEGPSEPQRARITSEEVDAHQAADRIIDIALTRADAILSDARANAMKAAQEAAREAAEAEQAKLAALHVAMRTEEAARDARDLDRAVALALVLAERLIGQAISQDPQTIVALARTALAEARGARRVRIEAHPLDAEALRRHLVHIAQALSQGGTAAVDVVENAELARGSLCVHTDLGTLDAKLTPRLERLAAALRDALKPA
jgi:flagellar biosynthesis/type III secretory pathway protein FliH